MAHQATPAGIPASKFVNPTSRYAHTPVLYYGKKKALTFAIYKRGPIRPASPRDQWLEIIREVEYRPDLVSYELYGSPDFWWKILEVNGMKDVLEFKEGRVIRLPPNPML